MFKFQAPFDENAYYERKRREREKEGPCTKSTFRLKLATNPGITATLPGPAIDPSSSDNTVPSRGQSQDRDNSPPEGITICSTHGGIDYNRDATTTIQDDLGCGLGEITRTCTSAGNRATRDDSISNKDDQETSPCLVESSASDVAPLNYGVESALRAERDSSRGNSPLDQSCIVVTSDGEESDVAPEEWEGQIIEEGPDGYVVEWKPSVIPKSYANKAMVDAWESKKSLLGKADDGMDCSV